MLIKDLRRYDPRGRLRKNRLFDPFSGRFTPIRPTNQRRERKGHPVSRTRETWLVPNVHLATVLPPHALRPATHALRSTPDRRGQVVRRPSPTGYCLTPTADLSKIKRVLITTNGPSIFNMSPNRAILAEKLIRCSLLATVGPLTILSWPEALNASRSKRACRMAIRRNACSLLALPDFPEFAQAVRHGVPGTPREGISWYEAKAAIVREAVRAYRSKPLHGLNATA
jgi:hypothetical protein